MNHRFITNWFCL